MKAVKWLLMSMCLLSSVLVATAGVRAGDVYRIAPGDTIEVGIASLPNANYRVLVQLDGTISVPGTDPIEVAGLTRGEMQQRVEMLLASKLFHFRTTDGREQVVVIKPEDIAASIADYRPVYVMGDVLNPGQQPYRPQMTVRQAIAVAGGYSLLRSRNIAAAADPIDLRRDYESTWADYTREYFRRARIIATLQDKLAIDMGVPTGLPLPPKLAKSIAQRENETLRVTREDDAKEHEFLLKAIREAGDQIAVLQKREADETAQVKADEEDLARIQSLVDKGIQTNARLADVRRALLLSSSRQLNTTVELMHIHQREAELSRQMDRDANRRRIALLGELNDVNTRLAQLDARLRAVSERLRPGAASAQAASQDGSAVQVTVSRKSDNGWRQLRASDDLEIEPGDVIEVQIGGAASSVAVR